MVFLVQKIEFGIPLSKNHFLAIEKSPMITWVPPEMETWRKEFKCTQNVWEVLRKPEGMGRETRKGCQLLKGQLPKLVTELNPAREALGRCIKHSPQRCSPEGCGGLRLTTSAHQSLVGGRMLPEAC